MSDTPNASAREWLKEISRELSYLNTAPGSPEPNYPPDVMTAQAAATVLVNDVSQAREAVAAVKTRDPDYTNGGIVWRLAELLDFLSDGEKLGRRGATARSLGRRGERRREALGGAERRREA